MTTPQTGSQSPSPSPSPSGPLRTGRAQPARPSVHAPNSAPVIAHVAPPLSSRLAEAFWSFGLAAGALAAGYFFITRTDELAHIKKRVEAVDPDRAAESVDTTADILFWVLFGTLLTLLLIQVWAAVAFANRRSGARAWLCGTLVAFGVLSVVALEFTRPGNDGMPLRTFALAYAGILTLALLASLLPASRAWTRRRFDVRRGPASVGGGDL